MDRSGNPLRLATPHVHATPDTLVGPLGPFGRRGPKYEVALAVIPRDSWWANPCLRVGWIGLLH
jgi:hypothetical protein